MSELKRIQNLLAELEFQAKKSWGQNFLINEPVIQRIVESTLADAPDAIIEVGPGLGALTLHLNEQRSPSSKLTLIEQDKTLADYWSRQGESVVQADALKVDWNSLEAKTLVSNLPYQISSSLVIDRSLGPTTLNHMVLMFQKEVAERILAAPRTKDYGLLSVMAQTHWTIRKLVDAGPRDFFPPPKVASRVLEFHRKNLSIESERFLSFLKTAFAQRRKTLLKNLKSLEGGMDYRPQFQEALESLGFSDMTRAEELGPDQFLKMFEVYRGN